MKPNLKQLDPDDYRIILIAQHEAGMAEHQVEISQRELAIQRIRLDAESARIIKKYAINPETQEIDLATGNINVKEVKDAEPTV